MLKLNKIEKVLIENGYEKTRMLGKFNLIGYEEIQRITKQFKINISKDYKNEEYLKSFKNSMNKIEMINDGLEAFKKGMLYIEIKGDKLFTYIQA